MKKEKHLAPYWEQVYRTKQDHPWSHARPEWWKPVLEKYQPHPQTALDIATGEGDKARWLAEQGYQVTALDISPTAIATATELARSEGSKVTFQVADMRTLAEMDLDPFSFGLILDVLGSQFLPKADEPAYFQTVAGLLAPKGLMVYKALERKSDQAPTITPTGKDFSPAAIRTRLSPYFSVADVAVEPSANRTDTNLITFFLRSKK